MVGTSWLTLIFNVFVYSSALFSLILHVQFVQVMEKAMFNTDNCYNIPNLSTGGELCKTNLPSNTAFRGFGGPQAMVVAETWINHVASFLKMAPEKVGHCFVVFLVDFVFIDAILLVVSHLQHRRKLRRCCHPFSTLNP